MGYSGKRTFPMQISSTSVGSRLHRSLTSFSSAKIMYSRLVSLKPPFFAFASGVRMASVMTMSSAFLDVLPCG